MELPPRTPRSTYGSKRPILGITDVLLIRSQALSISALVLGGGGLTHIATMHHFGGMPQELALESIQRFAEDVTPAFR